MLHLPSKQPTLAHDTQTTIVEHGFSNHSTWTVQKDTIAKMTFHHVRGGRHTQHFVAMWAMHHVSLGVAPALIVGRLLFKTLRKYLSTIAAAAASAAASAASAAHTVGTLCPSSCGTIPATTPTIPTTPTTPTTVPTPTAATNVRTGPLHWT